MKKILCVFCCMAVIGLTSCLGDSDNNNQGLSPQEVSQCFNTIKGNYTGKVLFENLNPNDVYDYIDTLDIAWSVAADTTIVVNQFPQTVILDRISDQQMKEALEQAAPAPLKAKIGFYESDPIRFMLYPYSVTYDVEYQDAPHKVSLAFWVNAYSFGKFDTSSRVFQMQLMAAGLYLDEDMNHNYLLNPAYDNSSIPIIITNVNLSK